MSNSIEGLDDFKKFLDRVDVRVDEAIENALESTGTECVIECIENSPEDTGTLKDSWQLVKNEDTRNTHAMTIWSDIGVINQNPKHPNGDYYSHLIENGFIMRNGKKYKGCHMLKNAFSNCKRNLKANLKKELGSAFNES